MAHLVRRLTVSKKVISWAQTVTNWHMVDQRYGYYYCFHYGLGEWYRDHNGIQNVDGISDVDGF